MVRKSKMCLFCGFEYVPRQAERHPPAPGRLGQKGRERCNPKPQHAAHAPVQALPQRALKRHVAADLERRIESETSMRRRPCWMREDEKVIDEPEGEEEEEGVE
jgi:hypothetical protein